ncbi:MAG: halo transducer protein [Haloferacaceae archaeon]
MTDDADVTVVGRTVDAAVEAAVAADPSRDPDGVRSDLLGVADDGAVTAAAVEERVGETSLVVATAENRVEFAGAAVADAREAAADAGVDGLDAVRARLDRLKATLAAVEADLSALQDDFAAAVDRIEGADATYAAVRALRDADRDARSVRAAADELKVDADGFARQVRDPSAWVGELAGDVDALAEAVDDLSAAVERVAGADAADADGGERGAGSTVDPGALWADARLRATAYDLLLTDLRAELADLREWPTGAPDGVDAAADRVAALDDRLTDLRGRLDAEARPAWRERHGDRVARFAADVADRDPPVDWAAVQGSLADHRTAVNEAADGAG